MDLREFVLSLDSDAFRALTSACLDRVESDRTGASSLTYKERLLAERGDRIHAVKAVKQRLNISLKEASDLVKEQVPQLAVESYNESM